MPRIGQRGTDGQADGRRRRGACAARCAGRPSASAPGARSIGCDVLANAGRALPRRASGAPRDACPDASGTLAGHQAGGPGRKRHAHRFHLCTRLPARAPLRPAAKPPVFLLGGQCPAGPAGSPVRPGRAESGGPKRSSCWAASPLVPCTRTIEPWWVERVARIATDWACGTVQPEQQLGSVCRMQQRLFRSKTKAATTDAFFPRQINSLERKR